MSGEPDPEHVIDFAFPPLGSGPDVTDGWNLERGIIFVSIRLDAGIEPALDQQQIVAAEAPQYPDDRKSLRSTGGVVQVIHCSDITEQFVTALRILSKETEGCGPQRGRIIQWMTSVHGFSV